MIVPDDLAGRRLEKPAGVFRQPADAVSFTILPVISR
jgi:hypothetical protein